MTYANVNGQLLPASEAHVSIHDRGFRFGDGAFETIALHHGVPYQYDWHITRLEKALKALKIEFDTSILQPFCRQLLNKNSAREGVLRIQVTRGCGSQGYLPAPELAATPTFTIENLPRTTPPTQGINLWLCTYKKISLSALPVNLKLCQGLNSTLARMEAQANGCFDALLLNEKNGIAETSSANLFWLTDNKLYTPSLSSGALEGSTRAAMLRLFEVQESEFTLDELLESACPFVANSSWGLLPVTQLQPIGHSWRDPVAIEPFRQHLLDDRHAYARANAHKWLIQ